MTLYCPISGLKVFSLPEWRNRKLSDTFIGNFYILGDSIIYSIPEGRADLKGVKNSVALKKEVAKHLSGQNGHYLQIQDYAALESSSHAGRSYFINDANDDKHLKTMIFCNLSPPLGIAVKIGNRFNTARKDIQITRHYREAITRALEVTEPQELTSAVAGFDLSAYADENSVSLVPVEAIAHADWDIETPDCTNRMVLIDRHILYSTVGGYLREEDIRLIERQRSRYHESLPKGSGIEYIVVDSRNLKGASRPARFAYMKSLRNWHRKHHFRMYIAHSANLFLRTALRLARPVMPFQVKSTQNIGEAFGLIREDKSGNPSTRSAINGSEKAAGVTFEDIERLQAFLGSVNWTENGIGNLLEENPQHPFYFLYQSIKLIKEELDDLFTERKLLEGQLAQSKKMEAIGTLAGGIAHDFNNLLMGIQGHASLMEAGPDPAGADREHLEAINEYITRATNLTRQLLGFARGGKYEVKPIDVNELLLDNAAIFGRTHKEINIHTELDPAPIVAEADKSQIEQVFMNMFVNARHAMPDGGRLSLKTELVDLDDAAAGAREIDPGRYIKIRVTDTGIGMDADTRQRIFDPFFTTKGTGHGTGLGLASAYGIVKNHSGSITVRSRVGAGTTFAVYLPASEKKAYRKKVPDNKMCLGSETVLLVDDEGMIVRVGQKMLAKLGYQAVIATSGKEALRLVASPDNGIDLVILDLIMPDMNGSETFDRLRELRPGLPVLLASGYTLDGQASEIMAKGCNGFIQKPFNLVELSQKVRLILDTAPH